MKEKITHLQIGTEVREIGLPDMSIGTGLRAGNDGQVELNLKYNGVNSSDDWLKYDENGALTLDTAEAKRDMADILSQDESLETKEVFNGLQSLKISEEFKKKIITDIGASEQRAKSYTDMRLDTVIDGINANTTQISSLGKTKADKVYTDELASQVVENTKEYTDEKVSNVANGQLKLSVKDNGNVVLSNAKGESKEFMPATPSGDPMHYAYINAGAEYNATGDDIIKNAPWAGLVDTEEDKVVLHKAGCWYLNGLGDLSNTDMSNIYRRGHDVLETAIMAYDSCSANYIKTNLDTIYRYSYSTLSSHIISYNVKIIVLNCMLNRTKSNVKWNNNSSFSIASSQSFLLSHILGEITETPQNGLINNAPYLKTIKIKGLKQNISFPNSPVLTKASVLYMINNSTATSAITITLHADAYARAMADASIVEALAAHTNVTLASA